MQINFKERNYHVILSRCHKCQLITITQTITAAIAKFHIKHKLTINVSEPETRTVLYMLQQKLSKSTRSTDSIISSC